MNRARFGKLLIMTLTCGLMFFIVTKRAGAQTPAANCALFVEYPCSVAATWSTLTRWADAWSARDIDAYLAFYASDAAPASNKSRAQWLRDRRSALAGAESVKIRLYMIDLQILDQASARVLLLQYYDAQHYSDIVLKTLYLRSLGDDIKIEREQVDKSLSASEAQAVLDAFN